MQLALLKSTLLEERWPLTTAAEKVQIFPFGVFKRCPEEMPR